MPLTEKMNLTLFRSLKKANTLSWQADALSARARQMRFKHLFLFLSLPNANDRQHRQMTVLTSNFVLTLQHKYPGVTAGQGEMGMNFPWD